VESLDLAATEDAPYIEGRLYAWPSATTSWSIRHTGIRSPGGKLSKIVGVGGESPPMCDRKVT
jgi:hypothetical protein